jgi:hypothetical protein
MPAAVPATEPNDADAFADAFNSLAELERRPVESGGSDAGAATVAASAADGDAASTPEPVAASAADPVAADGTVPAVVDPAAAGPAMAASAADGDAASTPEPVAAVADPKPVDTSANEDMLRRLAALVKEPAPAAAQPQRATPAEKFTAAEKVILDAYDKDWPDQSAAENIRRRADAREMVGYIFAEVSKELQPLMATVQELAARTQLGDIEAAVPGYNNDLVDKVTTWAGKETRPTVRAVYDHIIKQGTPAEVADLIQSYKQATGDTVAPAAPVAPAAHALSPAVKKAAAALAPVKSIRSAPPPAGLDPNNYDEAFAAASKIKDS